MLLGAVCCHGIVVGCMLRAFWINNEDLCIGKTLTNSYSPLEEYDEEEGTGLFGWRSEKCLSGKSRKIVELMGFSLLKNESFLAAIFMISCDSFSNTGWIVYFIPHCLVKGLSPYEATFSATAAGLANLVGRFIYVPFISKKLISVTNTLLLSGVFSAISLMVDPWTNTLSTILVANVWYCLSAGILKPLCDVHIKTITDERLLSQAFGLKTAMNGGFRVSAGFLVGKYDFCSKLDFFTNFVLRNNVGNRCQRRYE